LFSNHQSPLKIFHPPPPPIHHPAWQHPQRYRKAPALKEEQKHWWEFQTTDPTAKSSPEASASRQHRPEAAKGQAAAHTLPAISEATEF